MYGLVYPAVLGTGLVLFATHVARVIQKSHTTMTSVLQDLSVYPAIAAGFFYVLSFTALSKSAEEKERPSYQWLPFLVDWIEVLLMFSCFYFLRLIDETQQGRPNPFLAYGCLLVDVIVVQPVWRLFAGVNVRTAIGSRVVVGALLTIGMIAEIVRLHHPAIDRNIAFAVLLFVARYIRRDVEYQKQHYKPV
jgi:hypothetical protein